MVNSNEAHDGAVCVNTLMRSSSDPDTHLVEHVSQVVFRVHPGGHGVAEEDEVLEERRG